ncbi:TPA: hypothetical protein R6W50_003194 [Citrobacter gillenii]|uniref:hypothetical protein n=1 Tax=Citrobacter braakii TaxID=57706 RepID=UPI0024322D18|nr:hypothetical protein [Citrobacter braakii]WFV16517.1 hypothetical protein NFJ22_15940 [Citrobacter braakii]HEE0120447.1 hypothetical protein [Citrobacter gillenii]
MLYAYDPNDQLKHNIHINDWVVCHHKAEHHKPYEHLKNIPRDATLIPLRKEWLKNNLYEVYYKIKKEFPNLCFTWKDLELSVKSANDINVWALKDMPMDYIPYVLLVSVSKYPKTKIRKNEYFYVLETLQKDTSYSSVFWNDNKLSKKIIWEVKVSTSTNTVIEYDINLETAIPPYVKKIIDLL